jgi:hypothetical protein
MLFKGVETESAVELSSKSLPHINSFGKPSPCYKQMAIKATQFCLVQFWGFKNSLHSNSKTWKTSQQPGVSSLDLPDLWTWPAQEGQREAILVFAHLFSPQGSCSCIMSPRLH